ncbi:hypothetical protein [Planococcus sp. CAU13]|uniref:hypothetical protein n=1 Tax=Planococcus sp. CAU13 TaxID=1541197 RepID=UPI00052FEBB1|nr:hypothetical protein [Planococcus sp. CAU13]
MGNMLHKKRNEAVLVYLDIDSYNACAIQRGARLAEALGCAFHVWFSKPTYKDKKQKEQLGFVLSESKKLSMYFEAASFLVSTYYSEKDFRYVFKSIKAELKITQLVFIENIESRWEELSHGSTVNHLMKSHSDLELHAVSDELIFSYEQWDFEKGRTAFIEKNKDNYALSFQETKGIEGIFFKEKAAPLKSGIFISPYEDEVTVYIVHDGIIIRCQHEFCERIKVEGLQ